MKSTLQFDYENAKNFLGADELLCFKPTVLNARELLVSRKGEGNDFLGWLDLPEGFDRKELEEIKAAAKEIRESSDILLVIGIGGSYLGAKAAYELLRRTSLKAGEKKTKLCFVGNNLSSLCVQEVMEEIEGKDFSINVISKSGTTTASAVTSPASIHLISRE